MASGQPLKLCPWGFESPPRIVTEIPEHLLARSEARLREAQRRHGVELDLAVAQAKKGTKLTISAAQLSNMQEKIRRLEEIAQVVRSLYGGTGYGYLDGPSFAKLKTLIREYDGWNDEDGYTQAISSMQTIVHDLEERTNATEPSGADTKPGTERE